MSTVSCNNTSFLHLKIWQKNLRVKIRFAVVSSQNPDYSDVVFTMCVDREGRFFWEKKSLYSPPAVCNLLVWCFATWVFCSDFKEHDMPCTAKTTCKRGREREYVQCNSGCSAKRSFWTCICHFNIPLMGCGSSPLNSVLGVWQACRGSVWGKDEGGSGEETPVLGGVCWQRRLCVLTAACMGSVFH